MIGSCSLFNYQIPPIKYGKNMLLTLDESEEEIDYKNTKVFKKILPSYLSGDKRAIPKAVLL
jgi:hypothetical protein